eukprot:scaffold8160_cov144-Skeletonema_dohrnii-CCMP3373.AAC.2
MRVATEEEVKALQLQQQQQQQQRQRLKQQQGKQRRGLQIESVARNKQRQQAKSLHPKWQIPNNVIVKKIVLPPTPSQLRRAERR